MSRSKDIAEILGLTEAENTTNASLGSGGGGGSLTVYDSIGSLPLSGVDSGSMAFVDETNRMYINNGIGWYSATIVNNTPTWSSEPSSTLAITDSATPISVTVSATDAEGIPVTYSGIASDSAQYLATISQDSSVFTFTPKSSVDVHNAVTAGNLPDSDGGTFTYTFKASDGINILSKVATIDYTGLNSNPYVSALWRYLLVDMTGVLYVDLEPDLDHGLFNASGQNILDANHVASGVTNTGLHLNPGVEDSYNWFAAGANPFTDNPATGSEIDRNFLNTYSSGPTQRVYQDGTGQAAFIAIGFSTPTDINTVTKVNFRTYGNSRGDRIPIQAKLQAYTGDITGTYNSAQWADYATLNRGGTFGTHEWSGITLGSTITSVSG